VEYTVSDDELQSVVSKKQQHRCAEVSMQIAEEGCN